MRSEHRRSSKKNAPPAIAEWRIRLEAWRRSYLAATEGRVSSLPLL
jgi:hypothetical protein